MNELDIFSAAVDLSPEDREKYLDEACGDNQVLRERIKSLLRASGKASSFIESPVHELDLTAILDRPISEGPGTVIGCYKLLQQIGEGGMGVVFMAEQEHPIRRRVALKIIKPGMDTNQVVARFEAERQALALMNHQNIAQVLDVGATEHGRPYFVMELINGIPITKYCDQERLTPRDRLELFIPVCQAIQHAHQKGIIHRDLKPSNVLIALHDGRPVPKIIDFGVAKATNQRLTERTMFTEFGQVIGTLEYMSPEQAERNALDIDTRSDIYSLGVLLYELLTGTTPLDKKKLQSAGFLEMLRLIREEEPARPSTRLSQSGDALPSISAQRKTEPARLSKIIRGELDWIVMKCLEKERSHRYETANGLARDLQRYLADEPVEACPPSASYRLRKFARKNRAALTTALALFVVTLAGTAISTWQAIRATQAKADADLARQNETERAEGERKAREIAQKRLTQIEKGNEILAAIFADLNPRDEEKEGKSLRVMLGERLNRAVQQLEVEAIGEPLMVARLQNNLGMCLYTLGYQDSALPLFLKARDTMTAQLGLRNLETLNCITNLAVCYGYTKPHLSLPLHEETLRLRKELMGEDHPDTLTAMNLLGAAYRKNNRLELAIPILEDTLKRRTAVLGPENRFTLDSMNNLAGAYQDAGNMDKALPLFETTFQLAKDLRGPDHVFTLKAMNNLAVAYSNTGQLDRALPMYEECLRRSKVALGEDHPETLGTMSNLASSYRDSNQLDLALPLLETTLKLTKAKMGEDHPDTIDSMIDLAAGYNMALRFDEGVPLLQETVRRAKEVLGREHGLTLTAVNNLAMIFRTIGKLDQALPLYLEAHEIRKSTLGPDHPNTIVTGAGLAATYRDLGDLERAANHFRMAVVALEKRKFAHQAAGPIIADAFDCFERLKQYDVAEDWQRKWLAHTKDRYGPESWQHAGALAALGGNLLEQEKYDEATSLLRQCLSVREKNEPGVWTTFNAQSMLGAALLGQNKQAEAEPLLLGGLEGLKRSAATIPPQFRHATLTSAYKRMIKLMEASGKSEEAATVQKELDELKP